MICALFTLALRGRRIDEEEFHEKDECYPFEICPLSRLVRAKPGRDISEALAWDDLTGMRLDANKVIEAREKEIQYVRDMGVWKKIPRRQAQARGWKVIKTRWIDINKGDDENPNYRSRLVGKEFNNEAMDCIFAGTPPLEALRYVVHEAATKSIGQDTHTHTPISS